jgi:hypothetical protein
MNSWSGAMPLTSSIPATWSDPGRLRELRLSYQGDGKDDWATPRNRLNATTAHPPPETGRWWTVALPMAEACPRWGEGDMPPPPEDPAANRANRSP